MDVDARSEERRFRARCADSSETRDMLEGSRKTLGEEANLSTGPRCRAPRDSGPDVRDAERWGKSGLVGGAASTRSKQGADSG
jgi:hypothetical protein